MRRASDIPASGLDTARIRFEMMTPGVLWIDDLRIGSEAPSKSARLNARITLLAALQAYREQRFADFARLAESHWIRQSNTAPNNRLARANDLPSKVGARPDGSSDAAGFSPTVRTKAQVKSRGVDRLAKWNDRQAKRSGRSPKARSDGCLCPP